ncbi:MAG: tRNA (adenosine(37)-N6)-threonylcarbamoyltransferase complex transferase subunit TsaD [Candidatus Omnitrophota bacterium]
MLVLGIETSCDETAVSIVGNGKRIYSNVISSSLNFHKRYKGIIPEIASRKQLETISFVLSDALAEAGIKLNDIKLIAVTKQPGMPGCLVVGNCFARALSFAQSIPIIEINHLYAHIYAGFFNEKKPRFPFIGLVVSGGHTSLFYFKHFSKIQILGSTQDDACGEAFDKVASILGLGYPGGPVIERLAMKGDKKKFKFRCGNTQQPLNFSFSGIKTAVLYYVKNNLNARCSMLDAGKKTVVADIAASFQESVIEALIKKSFLACRLKKTPRLVIGGGVVSNNRLRDRFTQEAGDNGLSIYFSPKEYCADNAAMVAGLGYRLYRG